MDDDAWLSDLPEVRGVARFDNEIVVIGNERMLFSVVSLLAAHEIVPGHFQVDKTTLDDAFVALTDAASITQPIRRLHDVRADHGDQDAVQGLPA